VSNQPVIAWSHSRNTTFLQCPKKFFHLNVAKDVPFEESEAMRWGKQVHKALERRLGVGAELPSNMTQYEKAAVMASKVADRMAGDILCEQQLAVDQKLKPCNWFGAQTWGRCILDLLIINEETGNAVAWDWKTGKKKDDDRQLAIQAAFVFRHYPTIKTVKSGFVWLKEGCDISSVTFSRDREKHIWRQILPVVRDLTDAVNIGDWPARPSGLCGWCPVRDCKHWRQR